MRKIKIIAKNFPRIWIFPLILTLVLLALTALKLNGSSIGLYTSYFNGTSKDSALVTNNPRPIRSDEWIVTTQMTIAQKNNDFKRVNQNIGNGQDMSLISDVPYKEWSQIFKPHNLSFFVMPFENAFAFKWWVMGYLLILSAYFFSVSLMPTRRFFAALLSTGLFFSAFIQWWYQYITLAPLYYGLFIAVIVIHLMRQNSFAKSLLWAIALGYTSVCFALVLYPPFQIPCLLVIAAFLSGYLFEEYKKNGFTPIYKKKMLLIIGATLTALTAVVFFLFSRINVVHTFQDTVYPGARNIKSGGFDLVHMLSGNLGHQFLSDARAQLYAIPASGLTNQSESSNFIYLMPLLFLPVMYLLYRARKEGLRYDYPLITTTVIGIIFALWLYVPHLNILGKILVLNQVPHTRLLIGLGLLNFIQIVLFARYLSIFKTNPFSRKFVVLYALVIFVSYIIIGSIVKGRFPEFISTGRTVLFAIPIPVIIFFLLRKHFNLAALGFLAFACFVGIWVNPLYRGTAVLSNSQISNEIRDIADSENDRWISDVSNLENFATLDGRRSLTGVYTYPQLDIWRQINNGQYETIYNRYAHTNFVFDRRVDDIIPTSLVLVGADNFGITSEPCSQFLKNNNVRYILTELTIQDSCVELIKSIRYPVHTYYVYRLIY